MVSQMNYTTAEEIAHRTWFLLKHSRRLNARLGEETLTDLLVLGLLLKPYNSVCIRSVTKPEEAKTGADLIIYVHRGKGKADMYAVQAKKLYPNNRWYGRYGSLNKKSGKNKQPQIDVLERYAFKCDAIPLYLLYNYIDASINRCHQYWHCCKELDKTQFGCTLVPSWHIRSVIISRQNFCHAHESSAALPWRCAFDCPKGKNWRRIRGKLEEDYDTYRNPKLDLGINFEGELHEWPSGLWTEGTSFATPSIVPPPSDIMWDGEYVYFPRWIMLVDPYRE